MLNQVFMQGNDPLLNPVQDLDRQLDILSQQKQMLENMRQQQLQRTNPTQAIPNQGTPIWDNIDSEVSPMTDEQKSMLMQNADYIDLYNRLQGLVQAELLSLVKARIEGSPEGKELLNSQLSLVKKLKKDIVEYTNREMEMFNRFREFSKNNPNVTYEEFIKANM